MPCKGNGEIGKKHAEAGEKPELEAQKGKETYQTRKTKGKGRCVRNRWPLAVLAR